MIFLLLSCASPAGDDTAPEPEEEYPYEHLSSWELDGIEYEVAVRLWSDGAGKTRSLVPSGPVTLTEVDDWEFPEGSVVVKEFWFPVDDRDPDGERTTVETRLLEKREGVWEAHVYLHQGDDAVREVAGERVRVPRVGADGVAYEQEYLVPNTNQCESCHMRDDVMHLLGPDTRQMNVGDQIDELAALGFFEETPPEDLPAFPDPWDPSADLDTRARAYLHANCSHCHRPGAGGGASGLVLLAEETDPARYGVCKTTAAAGPGTGGFTYDIVPGNPDESIMVFRMASTDPELKMPELPNLLPDEDGLVLIREWIGAMEGECL